MSGIEAPYSYIIYYGTPDGTPPVNAGTFNSVIDVYDGPDLVEKIGYTLVIDPRPITIQADNQSKLLGAADPALTYTVTAGNLVTGNDLTGALTRESGETVGTYAILQGTLTAGSNYNLTFVPGTLTIEAVQHNISLVEGWNLVSLDLAPTSTAVEDVLASIEGSYDLVYAWDATGGHSSSGNWMKYDNEVASPDSLTAIDETMGFWVHMLAADTLSVEGTPPGISQINLWNDVGGWNLVSFPNTGPLAMPGALEDHYVENANYTLVYAYQASDTEDPWKLYDKDAPTYANDLTSMVPTWGYWIFVTIDEVWNVGD
jgi:hypothetical protein